MDYKVTPNWTRGKGPHGAVPRRDVPPPRPGVRANRYARQLDRHRRLPGMDAAAHAGSRGDTCGRQPAPGSALNRPTEVGDSTSCGRSGGWEAAHHRHVTLRTGYGSRKRAAYAG